MRDTDATLAQTGLATSNARGVPRLFVLRVTAGESRGAKVSIGARAVIVGSGGDCDLIVDDPKVSRRHLRLEASAEGVTLKDLGSRNGTLVNGLKVTAGVLPDGASLRIGDTSLKLSSAPMPQIAPSPRDSFGGLVGVSLAMREVFAVLELASAADATVLLRGESGTGKELAARAIHDHSSRAARPLITVDCSATHEQLVDSQLFGHKRGAFTGAERDRAGAFVEADGGTLFLDEIGELPLPLQAKLLRAVEARTVQPLGSDRAVPVDARLIAATHRDLGEMVDAGTFRADLYHRLSVVHVLIPPLRERTEDLAPLVRLFYRGRQIEPGPIEGDNLALLLRWPWPGNARELRNVLERAWVLAGPGGAPFTDLQLLLSPDQAPPSPFDLLDASVPFKEAKERWSAAFERRYLAEVFARAGNNITKAAEMAGINRRHFRELLEHHRLKVS